MKWINAREKLPKDYQRVLVSDGKCCDFAHVSNEFGFMEQPTGVKFWCPDNIHCSPKVNMNNVTHWMEVELPEKPEKSLSGKQLAKIRRDMENTMKLAKKAHKLALKVSQYEKGK